MRNIKKGKFNLQSMESVLEELNKSKDNRVILWYAFSFHSSFNSQLQYLFSEVDYPPQLIDEGFKTVIWKTNNTVRRLNKKIGLKSPKVFF